MASDFGKSKKILVFLILMMGIFIFLFINREDEDDETMSIVSEWIGREIRMPNNSLNDFLDRGETVKTFSELLGAEFKILLYIDSVGCMPCKLRLPEWNKLIREFEEISSDKLAFLLLFHQKNEMELPFLLKREKFNYPVFIDVADEINQLNNFPVQSAYQCFLLDKNNRVLLIGNPIKNSRIKDLYLKTILNEEIKSDKFGDKVIQTEVTVENQVVYLGNFDWEIEQQTTLYLKNVGDNNLAIDHVKTSCGCTSVEYSREPICPEDSISLNVVYKAEHPGYFNKTITVYCNANSSPVIFRIFGDAITE